MGAIGDMRDFSGVPTADVQSLYASTLAQYSKALLGPYQINGRTYTPWTPNEYLDALARLGNELLRRQVQPPSPDIGLMQATFGDPPPSSSGWQKP